MSILRKAISKQFTQIPNALIVDNRISPGAFRVACYLFSRPDHWTIRNKDIMKRLEIKQKHTIAKYWRELEAAGWISRELQQGGHYDYLIHDVHKCGLSTSVDYPQVWKNHTYSNTEKESNTERESNTDKRKNKQKEKTGAKDLVCSYEIPKEINLQAWGEFEQHRKEIKKPLTDLARSKNANILKTLTQAQQQATIDKTIANQWTGLFADRDRSAIGIDQPGHEGERKKIDGTNMVFEGGKWIPTVFSDNWRSNRTDKAPDFFALV